MKRPAHCRRLVVPTGVPLRSDVLGERVHWQRRNLAIREQSVPLLHHLQDNSTHGHAVGVPLALGVPVDDARISLFCGRLAMLQSVWSPVVPSGHGRG